jgi:hypothetical protein
MVDTGRGAWTTIGKDNGEAYYKYTKNKPLDGSTPEKSLSHQAVHLGVKAIQQRLVDLGYDERLKKNDFVVDGVYGRKTRRLVRMYQKDMGIYSGGVVGATTGASLWHGAIEDQGQTFNFDPAYIYGIMLQESGGDPGAVGWFTPGDRGLYQFNTLVHDVSYEQAHDYMYATERVFSRFNNAWRKYRGKGADLRVFCSIAQHNSPYSADQWFQTGKPPTDKIIDYVGRVLTGAAKY